MKKDEQDIEGNTKELLILGRNKELQKERKIRKNKKGWKKERRQQG